MFVTGTILFGLTLLVCGLLTQLMCVVAPRVGLVDNPDNHRKLHKQPVPLGGGVAIFLSTVIVLAGAFFLPNDWQPILQAKADKLLTLLAGGTMILLLGLVDDRFRIRGRMKLLGQIVVALMLAFSGLRIDSVSVFGWSVDLGLLAVPFTVCWLLLAINSVNLLDGIDGLASTLGFILVATIAIMSAICGHPMIALVAIVFSASVLGFLRFNFPPATIFLGDAGSMLIGLVVGALAIMGSYKGPGTMLLSAPLAVCTIPILDSAAAILRRKLTGRSIYTTDRGHLHHRLFELLGSNRKVLACVAGCCAVTSLGTLVSVSYSSPSSDLFALLVSSSIVIILVATGAFGRAELQLLTARITRLGRSFLEPADSSQSRVRQQSVRLQGSRDWHTLWEALVESAQEAGLNEIRLDVNQPRAHEGYHAFWERPGDDPPERRWRMEIPLVVDGQNLGCLVVAGEHGGSACGDLKRLVTLLEPFEARLRVMAAPEKKPLETDQTPVAQPVLVSARLEATRAARPTVRPRPR